MRNRCYAIYATVQIRKKCLLARASEAMVILRYALKNGFPRGDEEYERILSEARQ